MASLSACSLVKGKHSCPRRTNHLEFATDALSNSPILIAEISLPHQRGRLLSLQQWMITWGVGYHIDSGLCIRC